MPNSFSRFLSELRAPYKRTHRFEHRRWLADNGEARRYSFDFLTPESTVFDVGGFAGAWADAIHRRYSCHVHVFEPHPGFAAELKIKFRGIPKVTVHEFALGSCEGVLDLSDEGDASSALSGAPASVQGRVVDAAAFMDGFEPASIDLVKINIEGGEYDLLPALLKAGLLPRFQVLQVQFHAFEKQHVRMREEIVANLAKTHDRDWNYDFVWEQWSLRPQAA